MSEYWESDGDLCVFSFFSLALSYPLLCSSIICYFRMASFLSPPQNYSHFPEQCVCVCECMYFNVLYNM